MSHLRVALAAIVLALSLMPGPAHAGGWWHYVQFPEVVAVGETLEVDTGEVWFPTIEAAERAREQQGFRAYLIENLDTEMLEDAMSREYVSGWWSLGDATAYEAGTVTLTAGSSNLLRGSVSLEIPDVSSGHYWLMLCDLDCANAMGSVIPIEVRVVADADFAQLARRMDQLESRVANLRLDLRRHARVLRNDAEADIAALARDLKKLRTDQQRAQEQLGASLEALEKKVENPEGAEGKGSALTWFGLGGLVAAAVALRKKGTALWRSR